MTKNELEKKLEQGNLTDDDYKELIKIFCDSIKQRIEEAKEDALSYAAQNRLEESSKIVEAINGETINEYEND